MKFTAFEIFALYGTLFGLTKSYTKTTQFHKFTAYLPSYLLRGNIQARTCAPCTVFMSLHVYVLRI